MKKGKRMNVALLFIFISSSKSLIEKKIYYILYKSKIKHEKKGEEKI